MGEALLPPLRRSYRSYLEAPVNILGLYRTIGPVDVKNVWRDDLLGWIVAVPFIVALLLRTGVPPLTGWLHQEWVFDLRPYYELLMSFFVLLAPAMSGMVIGFLLLDERDERTLRALLVTPVPLASYLSYRLSLPLIFGFLVTVVGYPLAGLAPIPAWDLVLVALLASLTAPATALFLAVFATNKVAGFAWVKILNSINMLPVAAYFVTEPWQLIAGVVPAYWPMKMLWQITSGQGYAVYALIGLAVNAAVLILLLRRLDVKLHR